MAPTLYSSDIFSLNASPISSEDPPAKRPKKERTPRQAEALAAARQKRIAKRAGQETPSVPKEQECEASPAPTDCGIQSGEASNEVHHQPKVEPERKDRQDSEELAQLVKLREEIMFEKRLAEELAKRQAPPPKRRKEIDDNKPPHWFRKYIEGIRSEEVRMTREKVPKRVIREEAQEAADEHWSEPLTRARVNHEVGSHMDRLHSMIFGGRH